MSANDQLPAPESLTITLDNPAHGGSVIGRIDGQVAFISGGLPGETVKVQLDPQRSSKSKKGFRTGRVTAVTEASPHRAAGRCAAARLGGGCCDLDFVDATGSLAYKRAVVLDQLRRIGRLELDEDRISAVALEPETGWRTRVRLGVDTEGRAGVRIRASRDIVPLAEAQCAQWAPGLIEGLEDTRFAPGSEVAVALGDDGERSVVQLTGGRYKRKARVVEGSGTVAHALSSHPEIQWHIEPQGFWQGHRAAPDFYAQWIGEHIPVGEGSAWDLYGGAGVFAVTLRELADYVDCVDVASNSSTAGRAALKAAGMNNEVRYVDGAVDKSLDALRTKGGLHVVVMDPPRTGAGTRTVEMVAERGPQHVVHIGCDPATAARDLAAWVATGYDITHLTIVDAFPLTHHVEVLAALQPRDCLPSDGNFGTAGNDH